MAVRKGRVIKCLPYHEQWWAPRKYDIGSGKPIALLKARENLAKAGALPDAAHGKALGEASLRVGADKS